MKFISFIFFLFIFTIISKAQIGKYGNEFLNIGSSARDMGMGNASVASNYDGSCIYSNPANLTHIQAKNEINLLHSEYFASIAKYDFLNYTHKINDSSTIAFSLIRMGIDNIQNTLYLYDANGNPDYSRIKYFSVSDYAFFASYAKKLPIEGLSIGANAKIIYRHFGEFANAYGFGIDVGIKYIYKKWLLAAMLKDATSTFTAWFFSINDTIANIFKQTGNQLPKNSLEIILPSLYMGIARNFKINNKNSLLFEQDLIFYFDGKRNAIVSFNPISIYPRYALEWNYNKRIFLRGGLSNFQYASSFARDTTIYRKHVLSLSPSLGIGLRIGRFRVDYALTNIANIGIGLYSHVFSIKIIIDKNYNSIYRQFSYYK